MSRKMKGRKKQDIKQVAKQQTNKKNVDYWKIVQIIVFAALLALVIIIVLLQYLEHKKEERKQWLIDNCKCIEWEGELSCQEGYDLEGEVCVNADEDTFTNSLISCSRYQCENFVEEVG